MISLFFFSSFNLLLAYDADTGRRITARHLVAETQLTPNDDVSAPTIDDTPVFTKDL